MSPGVVAGAVGAPKPGIVNAGAPAAVGGAGFAAAMGGKLKPL